MIKESIKTIVVSLIFLSAIGIARAWTEPASTPVDGNTSAPINTSSTFQEKNGGLSLWSSSESNAIDVRGPLSGQWSASGINLGATDTGETNYWHIGYRGSLATNEYKNLAAWFYNGSDYINPLSITPTGNVGIGTTIPGGKLTVQTPNNYDGTTLKLESKAEPTNYNLYTKNTVTNGVVRWGFDMTNAGTTYQDMLIFDRGNVGIGITSPTHKFEVSGEGSSKFTNTNTVNMGNVMKIQNNSSKGYSSIDFFNSSGAQTGFMGYGNASATKYADNIYIGSANNRDIVIDPGTGGVGIGTTSPSGKLSVNVPSNSSGIESLTTTAGNTYLPYSNNWNYISGNGVIFRDASNVEKMRIDAMTGNVGIGTANPKQKLHIEGSIALTTNSYGIPNQTRSIGIPGGSGTFDGVTGAYITFNQGGSYNNSNWISFFTNQTGGTKGTRMTIAENGNVIVSEKVISAQGVFANGSIKCSGGLQANSSDFYCLNPVVSADFYNREDSIIQRTSDGMYSTDTLICRALGGDYYYNPNKSSTTTTKYLSYTAAYDRSVHAWDPVLEVPSSCSSNVCTVYDKVVCGYKIESL